MSPAIARAHLGSVCASAPKSAVQPEGSVLAKVVVSMRARHAVAPRRGAGRVFLGWQRGRADVPGWRCRGVGRGAISYFVRVWLALTDVHGRGTLVVRKYRPRASEGKGNLAGLARR